MEHNSVLHQAEHKLVHALNINLPSHAHGAMPSQTYTTDTYAEEREDDRDTIADEEMYEQVRRHSTNRTTNSEGVDVKRAEASFAALNRQMSHISRSSGRLSRTNSKIANVQMKDVEKAGSSTDSDEPFDLERTLRHSKQMEEEAGIKDKQIGI